MFAMLVYNQHLSFAARANYRFCVVLPCAQNIASSAVGKHIGTFPLCVCSCDVFLIFNRTIGKGKESNSSKVGASLTVPTM